MSTSTSGLLAGVQARPQSGSTPNLLGGRAASGSSLLSSAGASSLLSRRALPKKNLKVSTEKENAVPITRRIQKMNIPDSAHVVQVKACYEDLQYFYTLLEACDG